MSQKVNNSRRAFLQKARDAAVASTAITWLSTSHIASATAYVAGDASKSLKTFTQDQLLNLKAIAQTIIPKTDTPGAGDADCHGFIDHQLANCHSSEEQQAVISVLDTIITKSQSRFNKAFMSLASDEQQALLEQLEAQKGFSKEDAEQFAFLKQLVGFGYFTSQIGATQALNYVAVPGRYKGSIPADENTKGYGALAYYS